MSKSKKYFISGIDTNVGKTMVSAILTEALQADYWKPIQSGTEEGFDRDTVKNLISNPKTIFHKEAYSFKAAIAPHAAADLEHMSIDLHQIEVPKINNTLIIEGAGGLLVPLNQTQTLLDLIKKTEAEVILVSKNYLGSINHTLLSYKLLINEKIPVKGIIFNGEPNPESEHIIEQFTQAKILAKIPFFKVINKEGVHTFAQEVLKTWT